MGDVDFHEKMASLRLGVALADVTASSRSLQYKFVFNDLAGLKIPDWNNGRTDGATLLRIGSVPTPDLDNELIVCHIITIQWGKIFVVFGIQIVVFGGRANRWKVSTAIELENNVGINKALEVPGNQIRGFERRSIDLVARGWERHGRPIVGGFEWS
jgi:hypothetical protein